MGCSLQDVIFAKKEYLEIYKESLFLQALIASGVDNWEGYDDAMSLYREYLKEEGLES